MAVTAPRSQDIPKEVVQGRSPPPRVELEVSVGHGGLGGRVRVRGRAACVSSRGASPPLMSRVAAGKWLCPWTPWSTSLSSNW